MTNQNAKPTEKEQPRMPERVPFFVRAINYLADDVTIDDIYGSPDGAEPTSKSPSNEETNETKSKREPWDMSHVLELTYSVEYLGVLQPPPQFRVAKSSSTDSPSSEEKLVEQYHNYKPRFLYELTDAQVNSLCGKFLSDIAIYESIRSVLKGKLLVGELEEWEYEDYKQMVMAIRESAVLSLEEKKEWQRKFLTFVLLWMVAVDFRYSLDLALKYVNMIEARQVTLVCGDMYFALYPRLYSPEEVKMRIAEYKRVKEEEEAEKKAARTKGEDEAKKAKEVEEVEENEVQSEAEEDSD